MSDCPYCDTRNSGRVEGYCSLCGKSFLDPMEYPEDYEYEEVEREFKKQTNARIHRKTINSKSRKNFRTAGKKSG